ncbi:dihydrofolate reductase family protein [Tenggerimyces flavus]|uniref:Dihydrofolate reductase family protein n=1 Tax=Tenggerimyces flavus TaxID=1708749 RepID=A0ABV7Y5A1_9ACTN|nr:dihydrofolate reductase family protein [Tenggerimyces flavus]MBM7790821.1 dihydrofolate reductase [Tenggerimyces flavus]
MRSLILRNSLSLDGYAAPPTNVPEDFFLEYDEDEEFVAHMTDILGSAGVHAMGAQAYREMAGHWPYTDGPEADAMNRIPKVVFSRGPIDTPWEKTTVCSGDLATEIAALKAQDGGPILAHGGVRFAQALVRADLVDEYHLLINPIAHGSGSPLFTQSTKLKLVDVKSFPRGNLALTYTRP